MLSRSYVYALGDVFSFMLDGLSVENASIL